MADTGTKDGFSGHLGFIVASAGSAIGLGCLWRFPYLVQHDGGGAFVLFFIIFAVTFGVTLLMAEIAFGRRTGKSCLGAFTELGRKYRPIGYFVSSIPLIIGSFYCTIGGWVLKWLFVCATQGLEPLLNPDYWSDYIGNIPENLFWTFLFILICILPLFKNVDKGLEQVSKYLLIGLLAIVIAIIIYSFTIEGIWSGVQYYLVPEEGDITANTLLGAVGEVFFMFSLAMGIMITFGSYLGKGTDLKKSVIHLSIINISACILIGFMIIPLQYVYGFADESGMGLLFIAMPTVFANMPGGVIIAPIFFLLVLFAAQTSTMSVFEAVSSTVRDITGTDRKKSQVVTVILTVVLAQIVILGFGPLHIDLPGSAGMSIMGFLDTFVNSLMMPISAIIFCIIIGYIVGTDYITDEVESSGQFKHKNLFRPMIKYVCPILLSVILIGGLTAIGR